MTRAQPDTAEPSLKPTRTPRTYKCTGCGRVMERDNLKVRRVQFKGMGEAGLVEKTRTTGWLCMIPQDDGSPSCLDKDEDWQSERLVNSPGVRQGASG